MIYTLNGTITTIEATFLIIEVNSIGYMVYCTTPFLNKVTTSNATEIIIYHHFREDNQQLFGFETKSERELFETLISVSGIGPKVALGILSSIEPSNLIHAIQTDNILMITQCPGIGKKTAERMVIELKDKLANMVSSEPIIIEKSDGSVSQPSKDDSEDLMLALRQLGYQKEEIKRTFIKHATEIASVSSIEDQIKVLLKHL